MVELQTNGILKEKNIDWNAKSIDRVFIIVDICMDILGNT